MVQTQRAPKPALHPHRKSKWPWESMKVGEFFFSPRERNTMMTLASVMGKRLGRKFSTQMCRAKPHKKYGWLICDAHVPHDESVLGVGVWRDA